MSPRQSPPLSPVLIAGLLLPPPPRALAAPVLRAALGAMERRHRAAFERLDSFDARLVVIDPVELPLRLALEFGAGRHDLRLASEADEARAQATVRGPLLALVGLMQGESDGDALFFSRELVVEGETEAIVLLRNTLDGEDIDLIADLTAALGPLARPASALAGAANRVLARLGRDLDALQDAVLAPLAARGAQHDAALRRIDQRLGELERGARRRPQRAAP